MKRKPGHDYATLDDQGDIATTHTSIWAAKAALHAAGHDQSDTDRLRVWEDRTWVPIDAAKRYAQPAE